MYCVETIKSKTKHVCKREKCWIRDGPSKSLRYWKTFFQYHRYNAHKSVFSRLQKRNLYYLCFIKVLPSNSSVLNFRMEIIVKWRLRKIDLLVPLFTKFRPMMKIPAKTDICPIVLLTWIHKKYHLKLMILQDKSKVKDS